MSRATRFLDACAGKLVDRTPIWLMRQAGRFQPSYRKLREKVTFFELCQTPDLAAQVTLAAVEEFGVDAAIIFSDILVPLMAMGADVAMTDSGPKLAPIRDRAAIEALRVIEPRETIPYVFEAIHRVNNGLAGIVPQIGFAGAPLTLASYLVEGSGSKSFPHLKGMLFADPAAAHLLLDKLTTVVTRHLRAQIEAGCHAVQLFDSWSSLLSPDDYREHALPYVQRIFEGLADLHVPRILFAQGTTALLDVLSDAGADVLSVDWSADLGAVRQRLGGRPVQGNLDPTYLFMNEENLAARVQAVLDAAGPAPGFIFNLGHGVLPQTQPERVRFLVDTVHRLGPGKEN